ncbi:class I SAM-dependent methyltransferase [Paenibacillus whitsoniae]|uniref:Class I SAM-dependent methyltransferase n=1 Tax=Paenibacillus whitsoniae TaxID=2496558 RepID=A0A3S0BI83_9BACL|nr:class I SAM-dependent methyltransferase [Paenibacillus whitsoniae]RTE05758.1 class I SAM-dependent methyltransferase [Paenibacillus whitsoniae]
MNEHDHARILSKFNEVAEKYDSQRRKLIPCFDGFYQTAAALVQTVSDQPRILDLGAGTGLFSSYVYTKYPQAAFTLIDLSAGMLEKAKERFDGIPVDITYIAEDYTKYTGDAPFDAVISSLSIHHLEDAEKQGLYRHIHSLLKPGGVFVNADQVQGGTPYIDEMYRSDWKAKIEATDLTRDELNAAYERTKLDRMAPLDDQLGWLREYGFADVDCVFKSYNFVVMFGRKL